MRTQAIKFLDRYLGKGLVHILPKPRACQKSPFARFLVIRPGGIGDAILTLPTIHALKEAYPEACIDVLAEKRNAEGFLFSANVRRVYLYDQWNDLFSVIAGTYDAVIDTEQWHRLSSVVARLTRSTARVGFGTNERRRLFTHVISYSHEHYEVDSFLALLQPLGIESNDPDPPFISIPASARKKAGELLEKIAQQRYVVIFPGASIPERRWGAERFRSVAKDLFEKKGFHCVVVGGAEDTEDGERIVNRIGGVNLSGRTRLDETAAVIDRSALLLSGDSGILHIGVGLGKPTVSLFGPGIANKWAPQGESHIVLTKNLPCSPCTRFGTTPPCPIDAKCMQEITPEEVTAAVMTLLEQTAGKR